MIKIILLGIITTLAGCNTYNHRQFSNVAVCMPPVWPEGVPLNPADFKSPFLNLLPPFKDENESLIIMLIESHYAWAFPEEPIKIYFVILSDDGLGAIVQSDSVSYDEARWKKRIKIINIEIDNYYGLQFDYARINKFKGREASREKFENELKTELNDEQIIFAWIFQRIEQKSDKDEVLVKIELTPKKK